MKLDLEKVYAEGVPLSRIPVGHLASVDQVAFKGIHLGVILKLNGGEDEPIAIWLRDGDGQTTDCMPYIAHPDERMLFYDLGEAHISLGD